MEAKVKEELPEKEFQPTTERRKSITSKERKSPEHEEQRSSPIPAPSSPQNGVPDAVSPPLSEGPRTAPVLHRLRKFLSALLQFAGDVSPDVGDRVKQLIFNLVGGSMTIDEFQVGVQECTNYPLRASVPGFLRALLPHAQRDLMARARGAKQTPLQYIRSHEHLILESGSTDTSDIFAPASQTTEIGVKRRISDPFYDGSFPQTNGSQTGVDPIEYPPHIKRHPSNLFLNPSPFWYPMPSSSNMFDYHSYHGFNNSGDNFERKDGGITVRDVQTMNATFSETRGVPNPGTGNMGLKNEDEWKNINTMLNCILSMVEKTKRALAILQQRGVEPTENNDIKRAANEIMVAAVRQTEERVAEVRRRAEDAVNQVKRQALIDLQRAVGAAETKALELVAAERSKMERMMADKLQERRTTPPPGTGDVTTSPGNNTQQNCCWNCGRKAQETCSGCNAARYCGAFCQHKDWENHHQVCSGRDQKPAAMLTTSPPVTQSSTITKTLARSTTPSSTNDRISTTERLSLSTLNNVERMLSTTQDRAPSTDRVALASLSGTQGLIGAIGGKK